MCKACRRTYPNSRDLRDHEEVCRRVRSKATPWWLRTPGYFYTEELPRILKSFNPPWAGPRPMYVDGIVQMDLFRLPNNRQALVEHSGHLPVIHGYLRNLMRPAPRGLREPVTPIPSMTPAQVRAELARQIKRLSAHPLDEEA